MLFLKLFINTTEQYDSELETGLGGVDQSIFMRSWDTPNTEHVIEVVGPLCQGVSCRP